MKLLQSFVLSIFLMSLLAFPAFAAADIPDDVNSFAKTEGLNIIKRGFSSDPASYGYASSEETNNIQLGEGKQLYYVNPELLKKTTASLMAATEAKEYWAYLVLLNGQPKSTMIINRTAEGELVVSEFGGDPQQLSAAISKLTTENSVTQLIRLKGQFVVASKNNNIEKLYIPELVNLDSNSAMEKSLDSSPKVGVEVKEQNVSTLIKSLKETQSNTNDEDSSESLVVQEKSSANNWTSSIGVSVLIAAFTVLIVYYFLKRNRNHAKVN